MADGLKKAAVWLGLVSSDDYAADEPDADEATEEVPALAPVVPSRKEHGRAQAAAVTDLESRRPVLAPVPDASALAQIVTVHPRTYNEARTIGENFRDGIPVIMNLTEMDPKDAKRLVDFSAGLIFGLAGSIDRITSNVFLLTPHNVAVTAEDKERIAGGFYNQS